MSSQILKGDLSYISFDIETEHLKMLQNIFCFDQDKKKYSVALLGVVIWYEMSPLGSKIVNSVGFYRILLRLKK